MTRDYSQFLKSLKTQTHSTDKTELKTAPGALAVLGWDRYFADQISAEMAVLTPVRVTEVHRAGLRIMGEGVETLIPPRADAAVGDWLALNTERPQDAMLLKRRSLFKRRAPGTDRTVQLIAANVDTVFIVTSCNHDFNIARLERYMALAFEADVEPVIVLTKSDLTDTPEDYERAAWAISSGGAVQVPVVVLDARAAEPQQKLAQWCKPGKTLAFVGSSGVGKSTLVNALSGTDAASTQAIRADDSKGRHTTTARQLHIMPGGFTVMDTPGMRELQMTDTAGGIAGVFADLHELAASCKFNDCAHQGEPGCAVQAAVARGEMDEGRVKRWKKLAEEERHNAMSIAERRSKDRAFGRIIKEAQSEKHSRNRR